MQKWMAYEQRESHAHHWGLYKISKTLVKCAIDSFLQPKSDSSFRFAKNWLVKVKFWPRLPASEVAGCKQKQHGWVSQTAMHSILSVLNWKIHFIVGIHLCTVHLIEGVYGLYIKEFEPQNLAIPTKKGYFSFQGRFGCILICWIHFWGPFLLKKICAASKKLTIFACPQL